MSKIQKEQPATQKPEQTSPKKPQQSKQAESSQVADVLFHSEAERITYNKLKETLPKGSLLMHSVQISDVPEDWGLVEREIDFIVFHPSIGIFVIEVKGGKIGFDAQTGRFSSRSRHGRIHRIKDPFKQVHSVKTILLKMLRNADIKSPVSSVVVVPDTDIAEMDLPPFCNPKLVIAAGGMGSITKKLEEVFKVSHPEKFRHVRNSLDQVESFFRGTSFQTKSYLGDFIESQEEKVAGIEQLYQSFLEPLIAQKRVAVEGDAGTGKSFLAFTLAQKMRRQGKKTILLTSNKKLAQEWQSKFSKEKLGEPEELGEIKVSTYIAMAEHYGIHPLDKPDFYEGTKQDWLQIEAPTRWLQALSTEAAPYDVLICDEAQDVQPYWWEPLSALIKEDKSLFLFFDRKQGIFGSGDKNKSFEPERILPVPAPYFPLIHNYRSTDQIVKYAQSLYPTKDNLLSHSQRQGMMPETLRYKDSADAVLKLKQRIAFLIENEQINPSDIQVLSALRVDHPNSILRGVKLAKNVRVSTVSAYKGLEAKIAILVNFSEHKMPMANPLMRNLLYVANTRAKHHLISLFRDVCDKGAAATEALSLLEPSPDLVVEKGGSSVQQATLVDLHSSQALGVVRVDGRQVLVVFSSSQYSSLKASKSSKAELSVVVDSLAGVEFAKIIDDVDL